MNINETVFARKTDKPCPICVELVKDGFMHRDCLMPLPEFAPLSVFEKKKICFDCQSAENLMRILNMPEFEMSRRAVANERMESLRLPVNLSIHRGLCMNGYVKPCGQEYFESHLEWLDTIIPLEEYRDEWLLP